MALGAPDKLAVPVEPFQRAFRESGLTAHEVAHRLGWFDRSSPDANRVLRVLGVRPYRTCGRDRPWSRDRCRTALTFDVAERMADALGVGRWEVGL